jgi:hypothetical protein
LEIRKPSMKVTHILDFWNHELLVHILSLQAYQKDKRKMNAYVRQILMSPYCSSFIFWLTLPIYILTSHLRVGYVGTNSSKYEVETQRSVARQITKSSRDSSAAGKIKSLHSRKIHTHIFSFSLSMVSNLRRGGTGSRPDQRRGGGACERDGRGETVVWVGSVWSGSTRFACLS